MILVALFELSSCVSSEITVVLYYWWLQPEDWDDKEYIPDPEDKKPEVMYFFGIAYIR